MKNFLFFLLLSIVQFDVIAQTQQDIEPLKFKRNYVTIMPFGLTTASLDNYTYGVGLERKVSKCWSLGAALSFGRHRYHPYFSKIRNIKISAQYIAISNRSVELSGGLAFNYVREYYYYGGGISHSGNSALVHFGAIGFPVTFKIFITSWLNGQVMCQPSFSKSGYLEFGHLSLGVRF